MEHLLKEIGLSDSETKIYKALLEQGDSTRKDIVKATQISGAKIYEVLDRLQKKGLVSIYLKDNIKHFKPTSPKQILYYLEEKRNKIKSVEEQVNKYLPSLLSTYNTSNQEQEVEIITGFKGMQMLFREQIEILNKGETNYVIGGTKGVDEGPIQAFFKKIHLMREQKGIKTKMLYNKRQKEIVEQNYSDEEYSLSETRYISHASAVAINIYKNITAISIWGKEITIIKITSEDVANSFLEYFEILWKTSEE